MKIIPAIDIIGGKCVRLSQGDYKQMTTYSDSPLEVAKRFESFGVKFLHLVDLDGAKSNGIVNYKILEAIASQTNLQIDFGGGLKSEKDINIAFESGAAQITLGSVAVTNPLNVESWVKQYGPDRIILGADCKNGKIATHGWQKTSKLDVYDFIASYQDIGLKDVICTDIAKDGMLAGPAVELYKSLLTRFDINLIASGGISSLDDLKILREIGCEAAIIGKALYENKITLKQLATLC